ncbi:methyltransferase domain-containing protein [Nocardioides acrostichi]|uniref:Methyltransferase domain-containing protein n=1 Tax=Nocardioides acrostichi TaxID=2784339 RepID=A0A930Y4F6_9ACTN|nr:methyltransferase domain-containing protein [Nocardioides acrostichi]MBF4160130.1 methyltransferase domain-containing protein [Nocardioides acrostichi]
MAGFDDVESIWSARLGSLRNTVRQHLVRTQLHAHLGAAHTVLDVGCGQGTQALELAADGCEVIGVDPSADLLARATDDARRRGLALTVLPGVLDDLGALLPGRSFDLVCAHGLLMYLPDAEQAVASLTAMVRPGGLLSFTFRNVDALAMRPGLRGDWDAALAAFGARSYVNELGADAYAHGIDDVAAWCQALGLAVEAWYGVRVLTDPADADVPASSVADLDACLRAEEEAGRRDPYRRLGSMIHVVARR